MKRMILAMTLVLALILGCAAIAEPTDPAQQAEQAELVAPNPPESSLNGVETAPEADAAPENAPAPQEEAAPEEAQEADALADALNALHDARSAKAVEALQAELDEYVAAGKLTQEQADLIMKEFQQRQENGRGCPQGDCRMRGKGQNGDWARGNRMGGRKQYGDWQSPDQQQNRGNRFPGMPGADANHGM